MLLLAVILSLNSVDPVSRIVGALPWTPMSLILSKESSVFIADTLSDKLPCTPR